MCGYTTDDPDYVWKDIWSWKGPERLKIHTWKAAHRRLLTNLRRSTWYQGSLDCSHCVGISETSLHAFRDCPMASQVWIPLIRSDSVNEFYAADLQEWIHNNLVGNFGYYNSTMWPYIFMSACSLLWHWRNLEIFSEDFNRPPWPHKMVVEHAKVRMEFFLKGGIYLCRGAVRDYVNVRWLSPPDG